MKKQLRRFTQIAFMLFVFAMMLPNVMAQTIGSQLRIGADSTISYWNGTAWITVAPGLPGQSLQFTNGVPAWIDPPVTDYDGNVYDTVRIGTQTWMKQNLKVTHYRNGDTIPNVTDNTAWSNLTTGAYCNYNNDVSYATTYGRLYNWYTVVDSRNLCPIGWHVPSDAEWTVLTEYSGGEYIAGGNLKEVGTIHWKSPNYAATNETGFTALPGGYRMWNGTYYNIGNYSVMCSSTLDNNANNVLSRSITYYNNYEGRMNEGKMEGYSVRCLKD